MASPSPSPGRRRATLSCALCGGAQVHPGPRVEAHLLNEHGVVLDVDFFVRVALFKRGHGRMPRLEGEEAKGEERAQFHGLVIKVFLLQRLQQRRPYQCKTPPYRQKRRSSRCQRPGMLAETNPRRRKSTPHRRLPGRVPPCPPGGTCQSLLPPPLPPSPRPPPTPQTCTATSDARKSSRRISK